MCEDMIHIVTGGIPLTNAFFGQGSGGIFLNNVRCNGNEDALINCSHDGIGVHTCTHSQDAGVRCLACKCLSRQRVGSSQQQWRRQGVHMGLYAPSPCTL